MIAVGPEVDAELTMVLAEVEGAVVPLPVTAGAVSVWEETAEEEHPVTEAIMTRTTIKNPAVLTRITRLRFPPA